MIALSVQLFFLVNFCQTYKISQKQVVLIYICTLAIEIPLSMYSRKIWGIGSLIPTFPYLSIVYIGLAYIFKLKANDVLDIVAPCWPLTYAIIHIGCSGAGCCYGYPSTSGIWNYRFEKTLFPIQLLKSAVLLFIFLVIKIYSRKKEYKTQGKLYPLFLIMFGIAWIILEFLVDNRKVIWGLSTYALHAAFMALVGLVWYFALLRKVRKAPSRSPE